LAGRISCRISRPADWLCHSRGKPIPVASRAVGKIRHQRGCHADTGDISTGPPDSRAAWKVRRREIRSPPAPWSTSLTLGSDFWKYDHSDSPIDSARHDCRIYPTRASPSKGRRMRQWVGRNTSVGQIPLGIRTGVFRQACVARGRACYLLKRHWTSVVIARAKAKTTEAAREAEASLDRLLPPSKAHRAATRKARSSVSYRGKNVDRKWIAAR